MNLNYNNNNNFLHFIQLKKSEQNDESKLFIITLEIRSERCQTKKPTKQTKKGRNVFLFIFKIQLGKRNAMSFCRT